MKPLTLSLHLNSFPHNTPEAKVFHIEEVHQETFPSLDTIDDFHWRLHLANPQHGFKKGVVKTV